jgi:hypothetical protein
LSCLILTLVSLAPWHRKKAPLKMSVVSTVVIIRFHLLSALIFYGRFDRKEEPFGEFPLSGRLPGSSTCVPQRYRLMTFFLPKTPFSKNLSRKKLTKFTFFLICNNTV